MKNIILWIFSYLNYIYPKSQNKVLFISSPDLTDNSFAVFKYIMESSKKKKKYIWLLNNIKEKKLCISMLHANINISNEALNSIKFLDKKSFAGMWAFIGAKYIFFTHGFYTGMGLPKRQIRVNLWHGMPLKAIGYLNKYGNDAIIPKSSVVIATSELYQDIMGKVFSITHDKVWITGQPRCDLLWESRDTLGKLGIEKKTYRKVIFWTPTYRYAKDHPIQDGIFTETLPILKENDIEVLNHYLHSIDTYMLVKLHPMDMLNLYDFEEFSNIRIIKDNLLLEKGIQLYSLLSEIDILVTDFSSIYIDFLLLNRPIVFAIDDFDTYKKSRDFVFSSPKDYMPGSLVDNTKSLISVLNDIIINDNDQYGNKRNKMKKSFHTYENFFSKRLIESLKL